MFIGFIVVMTLLTAGGVFIAEKRDRPLRRAERLAREVETAA
ncbi:hypothetical protein [Sphingomonas sp. AX6]|nr:hypothetical protein [Sphingomonas sp. AX6]VXC91594.1 conserved hypothetical protein [Sphingomonas sp. AX6]